MTAKPADDTGAGEAFNPPFPIEKLVGVIVHEDRREIQYVSADCLTNRIERDSINNAKSFDALCSSKFDDLSRRYSSALAILLAGLQRAGKEGDERRVTCATVLMNAHTTLAAAAELLRRGYRLQPGILIRNIIESACTVFEICHDPNAFQLFKRGDLTSSRSVTVAKKFIPPLGHLYGVFSSHFAHLGILYREPQPTGPYTQDDLPLTQNLMQLDFAQWLLHATTELLFLDMIDASLFWERQGHSVRYRPHDSVLEWLGAIANQSEKANE